MADGTSSPATDQPRSSTPVDLRPLTTSELIDRGFSLYRANFTGLLLLALLCQIVPLLSQLLATTFKFQLAPTSLNEFTGKSHVLFTQLGAYLAVSLVCQIIYFCFEVVMTFYIADAYLGKIPSVKASLRRFSTCIGGSIWTCLLNRILIGLTFIFPCTAVLAIEAYFLFYPPDNFIGILAIGGAAILLFVASMVPVLVVFMRLWVTVAVLALEGTSGWKAVKRSFTLVRYDPGLGVLLWGEMRLSFLLLPLFAIDFLFLSITSLPLFFQHASDGSSSDAIVIGSQILIFLTSALILPLYSIATVLFYYDVRIRREGFDLEFMAQNMGKQP